MSWHERASAWSEAHRFHVDAAWTAVLGLPAVLLSGAFVANVAVPDGGPLPASVWAALLVAPLAWRRVRPVESTTAVALVAAAHVAIGGYPLIIPADFAILVALWSVTVYGPAWAHRIAVGAALLGAALLGGVLLLGFGTGRADLSAALAFVVMASIVVLAAWSFGLVRRARRETLAALRDRARRLELERDNQATIATAAERARIAREMHDIVAHSLSVIIAQADGGRYAATANPEAATHVLEVIGETGRAALADMRRLLGVLRSDDATRPGRAGGPGDDVAPLTPQPDEFETLIDQARDAGMAVSLVRVGEPRRLPPGAGLTLHRICQEALTNVRKHGGPDARVTVVVRWSPGAVELEVSDDGRGAAAADDAHDDRAGYGLLGMRERAAMFGGQVTAGPRPGGGWRVRFAMPLPAGPASETTTPREQA